MYVITVVCWALLHASPQPEHSSERGVTVPALIARLASKDPVERREAAYELGLQGQKAVGAVPKLLALLRQDVSEDVRIAAAYALARAGHQNEVVPALAEALKGDAEAGVRLSAAAALGDMGAGAKGAIPALANAMKDTNRSVRINAASALGQIGPDKVADRALWEALKDESLTVRVAASVSLLKGKPERKAPFVVLLGAMKRDDDLKSQEEKEACFAAAGFLVFVSEKHASMVPALVDALGDANAHVRYCAAHTLGLIGPAAKSAIPVLRKALEKEHGSVRESAAQALEKIELRATKQP